MSGIEIKHKITGFGYNNSPELQTREFGFYIRSRRETLAQRDMENILPDRWFGISIRNNFSK